MSLPARGAWIETVENQRKAYHPAGRSPHGGRGLKRCNTINGKVTIARRSPHGGRGLKQVLIDIKTSGDAVAPRTGGVD